MRNKRSGIPWQTYNEKAIRKLQANQLRKFLNETVVPFSAHYREVFHKNNIDPNAFKSLEDLHRIPFSSKADLLNTPQHPQRAKDFLIIPEKKRLTRRPAILLKAILRGKSSIIADLDREFRPVFLTSTTGRSADPIPFLYTNYDLKTLAWAGNRIMQVCGAQKEFRLVNMFPYAPHLAFWLTHYASTEFGVFTVGTGGGKVLGTDGNLRMIEKIDPDVLIGMPTFIYHVLHQAANAGIKFPRLKKLVLGGEKVADGIRLKLRQLARELGSDHIDVLATYGFTEAKMAWAECPHPVDSEPSGYHLYPDLGLFEIIDPKSGQVQPPGCPGELVFTPLDARGTVVLRYRTGDIIDGGMTYKPCPYCGRSLPRLVGKISRNSEIKSMRLDKIKGTLVDFNQLEHVLDDAPHVSSWQLELRKVNDDPLELDELVLHIHKSGNVPKEQLREELSHRFMEKTEIRPNRILFHSSDELRHLLGVGVELKEQKIIDNRPGKSDSSKVADSSPAVVYETAKRKVSVESLNR